MYQEGPVDYSSMTRGTYFDRPEVELRYRFIGTDDFTFGLTGGFRNYGYHFKDEHGAKDGSANMQRYKVQPDWDIKLTEDWRFGGWFAMYQFANDLEKPAILTAASRPKPVLHGQLTKRSRQKLITI